ncbi:hypothetical protein K439DRAFT_1616123 [Ramaria rubella]|nr:hypothetical protein K439DRAFT_1616123 [Ramaria rubella]
MGMELCLEGGLEWIGDGDSSAGEGVDTRDREEKLRSGVMGVDAWARGRDGGTDGPGLVGQRRMWRRNHANTDIDAFKVQGFLGLGTGIFHVELRIVSANLP